MKLSQTMQTLKAKQTCGLIPYITAGDPSLETTLHLAEQFCSLGAAAIELGVPFSDPLADGPTNQRAAARALKHHTSLTDIFELTRALREKKITTPIVLFTYFNPVFRMGLPIFAKQAQSAGVSGTLVVDLPPEEAGDFLRVSREHDLENIFLASPTTSPQRLKFIDSHCNGFLYYISRTGVTGASHGLASDLKENLKTVRANVQSPLAVGFGISRPEHVRELSPLADALVVGSALVQKIEDHHNDPKQACAEVLKLYQSLQSQVGAS